MAFPKLSAQQAQVLGEMARTGKVIAVSDYTPPRLVDQATDGTGVDSDPISRATVNALQAKGCLQQTGKRFPVYYYGISFKGQGALAQIEQAAIKAANQAAAK